MTEPSRQIDTIAIITQVRMLDPMKGATIGPKEVAEKFGVPPHLVIDVQALAGDSVDNVPGVPGIGVKTAAKFINQYGSLENLLAHADEIKGKTGERLRDHADAARMSKRLVTLRTDVPVPVPLKSFRRKGLDYDKLLAFLRAQSFTSLVGRVEAERAAKGVRARQAAAPAPRRQDKKTNGQGRRVDLPQTGYFEVKMVKGGVGVAARLWRPCQCTIHGPDVHDWLDTCDRYPRMVGDINGRERDRESAVWWVWLGGRMIDRKMYDYLLADAEWCRLHAPDEPRGKPWRPADINRSAPAI